MTTVNEQFFTARGYENAAGEDALTPSMEDYLEMIYRLSQTTGYTRVNDLAASLNVQPPSVTKMVQKLCYKELLDYERYGMIHLTEKGRELGKYFLERHNTVKEFLSLIEATNDLQKDVETLEHYFSYNNFQVLSALVDFLKVNPEILERFHNFKELHLRE